MTAKLDCSATYVIEDERAMLRPLQAGDYDLLLPFALHEPDLWKYSLVTPAGREGLRQYVDQTLKQRGEGREYPFIVLDKKTGEYAGSTRFYDINNEFRSVQLGYTWYGSKFQGTGLNRHCKYLLLQLAFEELNMVRVEFRADNNNARSIAAMKSIGCTVEGVLRSNMPTRFGEDRRDSIILSILRDEWFGHVKKNLAGKLKG